jgi:hypothetical protein
VRLKAKHKIDLQEMLNMLSTDSTNVAAGDSIPPGDTAGVPPPPEPDTAEAQLADFESELGENPGMTPEMVLNLHRKELNPANPEDVRFLKLLQDKYGIK